jgi:hypothetical protein
MSQSVRQSELFAGQMWEALYRAFTTINFNASDPESINAALREYMRQNFAEDFQDWIASSEFVAIIDLLSYLGGTIAFKTDINARENFLEVAEARESILRLARFLSYNPRRNYPSRGLLKLREIQTDDDVYDAFNVNLQNLRVIWDNPDDPDWFERFILILNSAFQSSNPFGNPLKQGEVGGVTSHAYRLNARYGDASLGFFRQVSGVNMPFEFINTDFEEDKGYIERTPSLNAALQLIYRTDGNGNASKDTGFFMGVKQGNLQRQEINLAFPIENQVIDINADNVNETDIWVQTLTDTGDLWYTWDKVPAVFSDNITFNSLEASLRNIYSVITRDRDQASLRFADGRFGNAPVGNLRVWFRTSNGLQYVVRPQDLSNIQVVIPYENTRGLGRFLTLVFSLEEPISNSTPRENEEDIRRRAPLVYAAQNRMVSGEDYNSFPLSSNQARKIKSLVRVYSGHSRFIDLNDPTGTYKDVNVFADDGIFYKERTSAYTEIPISDAKTASELLSNYIQPMLRTAETQNVIRDFLIRQVRAGVITAPQDMFWYKANDGVGFATGWFNFTSPYLAAGSTLLVEKDGVQQWVAVTSIFGDPTGTVVDGETGPVTLAERLETGWKITAILPPYSATLDEDALARIGRYLNNNLSFSLWYDYAPIGDAPRWLVKSPEKLDQQPQVVNSQVKIFLVENFAAALWRFSAPGLRFQFESLLNVRFYFNGSRAVDTETKQVHEDIVRVLRYNADPITGLGLGRDFDLKVDRSLTLSDGFADPRRVGLVFGDSDGDGFADDPDTYYRLVTAVRQDSLLFWKRNDDGLSDPFYAMTVYETENDRALATPVQGTVAFQLDGEKPETFWMYTNVGWVQQIRQYRFARGRGPNVASAWFKVGGFALTPAPKGDKINFQWKHFATADKRIDPAKTNLIDCFVLTSEYDFLVRQWIANGARVSEQPTAPTELALRTTFSEFEEFKMFSDSIVWRPVKYRFLFGEVAEPALRCTFKVVKLKNASLSDGEIKASIVKAIGQYFNADFWDFGETFYFTELAAFVHQQLATSVSSIVPVPEVADASFGDGFEIKCRPDELFISTAQVTDITIIDANTPNNLRIR